MGVEIEKGDNKMRTYYIEVERQGWALAVVKVEAETYEEAELKALKALHATDDLSEIDENSVKERVANGDIDYVIDENGDEIELEDEENEESKSVYKLYMEDESGFENIYTYYDYQVVLSKAMQIWDNGEGGYCKVSIHEVASEDDEISEENQIWEAHH